LGKNQTIHSTQIEAVTSILEKMREAINPEFIGIISSRGLPVTVLVSASHLDVDTLSSLASSSFAATSQLAHMNNEHDFAVMFHEGQETNIHIASISKDYLLVIFFPYASDIGKVRIISKRAHDALASALAPVRDGINKMENGLKVEETRKAIDEIVSNGRYNDGTD
jgi:predicted regulator of Ras-like GTPase activity (Roadblock/LC7/MglB family)